jgi:DNA-binding NarL/FixJ family response regulator
MSNHRHQIDNNNRNERGEALRCRSIVILSNSSLAQDCIAKFIAAEFPDFVILKLDSIANEHSLEQLNVVLAIVQVSRIGTDDKALGTDLHEINKYLPGTPIVLLLHDRGKTPPSRAQLNCVSGLIFADEPSNIVAAALRLVLAGGTFFAHAEDAALSRTAELDSQNNDECIELENSPPLIWQKDEIQPRSPLSRSRMTPREHHVLVLLQQGLPNKTIAHRLKLSENTVKVHVRRIMKKLNAKNRTEAVLRSQQLHEVSEGDDPKES